MAVSNNVLRFYIDDNDTIYKCDFFEEKEFLAHNTLDIPQEDLMYLFKRFIEDARIHHEEKIFDNYILFKFYNVDKKEILDIIEYRKFIQKAEPSKFKPINEDNKVESSINTTNNKRKVTRKNRFRNSVIKVGAFTLATLIGISVGSLFIKILRPKEAINTIENKTVATQTYEKDRHRPIIIDTNNGPVEIQEKDYVDFVNTTNIDEANDSVKEKPIEQEQVEEPIYDQYICVEADDWTTTDKYKNCKENYYDLITKYAKMYGIDPQIALGIACHERGVHSEKVDSGGGLGLYQVQIEGVWDNQNVKAYNFETNSWETYTIHKNEISKLENNIKAGLMIFQEALKHNDYDIAKSIQEYNYGYGWMGKVMRTCYTEDNPETEANKYDWLNYRSIIKGGDPIYIENVLKYVDDGATFEFKKPDGTIVTCKYDNLLKENEIKNRL